QANDAESQYPVYVRVERGTFQALFGDYETGLTQTELGRYARRLSGLKIDYEGEQSSLTAFAAETRQGFVREEIAADGTSGPFRLRQAPLVQASEVIRVETRDRARPDQILKTRFLSRYLDYEIDVSTGEIVLRTPVNATDGAFNPNVIVAEYETRGTGERGLIAGGRAAVRDSNGRIEFGATALHEDASGAETGTTRLGALDLTVKPRDDVEIRAEIATSETRLDGDTTSGEAFSMTVLHTGQSLNAEAYIRQEDGGFGLGQQSTATAGIRRYGARITAQIDRDKSQPTSNRRVSREVQVQAYREEALGAGAIRDVADIVLSQESADLGLNLGLRAAREDFSSEPSRQSVLLVGGARKTFAEHGLTLSLQHEQPITASGEAQDRVSRFPGRSSLGITKSLGNRASVTVRHDVISSKTTSGDTTLIGVNWTPLAGTQVQASTDFLTRDSGQRLGATVGVDQTWQITKAWTANLGLARRANIASSDQPLDAVADSPISPLEPDTTNAGLETGEGFTSAYIGAGYRGVSTAVSGRVEGRDSAAGERWLVLAGGAREVSEQLSFSGAARVQSETLDVVADRESADLRLGVAWRPEHDGIAVLSRLDLGHEEIAGVSRRTKIVENIAVNVPIGNRWQASINGGVKYVEGDFDGAAAQALTTLIGGEVRYDVSSKIDIGAHAHWWSGDATQTSAWAFGPSLGFSPRKNVWASIGWTFEGVKDDDFAAAEYTRSGPSIKLRVKFDQDTLKGLIDDLGLGRAN
ncbi:MAG: hypothetical protein AAGF20_08880, partial [Pseudomonadota bacterium]